MGRKSTNEITTPKKRRKINLKNNSCLATQLGQTNAVLTCKPVREAIGAGFANAKAVTKGAVRLKTLLDSGRLDSPKAFYKEHPKNDRRIKVRNHSDPFRSVLLLEDVIDACKAIETASDQKCWNRPSRNS